MDAATRGGLGRGGLPGFGSAGCTPRERGERCGGQTAPGALCVRGRPECRGCGPASLSPSPPPPRRLPLPLQRASKRGGFPGGAQPSGGSAPAAAFIAVRQTGRNSHFPPGRSPARAGRPGAHFNPLCASGARPDRPSCLLAAAGGGGPGAASREAFFPGLELGTTCRVSRRSSRWPEVTGEAGDGKAPAPPVSRAGPVSAAPENGVWDV